MSDVQARDAQVRMLKTERIRMLNSVIKVIILNLLVHDRLASVMLTLSEIAINPKPGVPVHRIVYLRCFSLHFLHFVIGTSIGVICEKFTRHESLSLFSSDSRTPVAQLTIGILYRFIGMFKHVTSLRFFF